MNREEKALFRGKKLRFLEKNILSFFLNESQAYYFYFESGFVCLFVVWLGQLYFECVFLSMHLVHYVSIDI